GRRAREEPGRYPPPLTRPRCSLHGATPMTRQISEADWKIFRQLHQVALERFCQRALSEAAQLASGPRKTAHALYSALFHLLQRRGRDLAALVDDVRRSTILLRLVGLRSEGLVTDEEFARFSPEARAVVSAILHA